ncbi:TetR/AcrR family transcriptional regulator [Microbacterium sp. YY-01]|uniref:TetR/AcrR family transcriptional regulator n=1 Tax=Microbacterium sp. YY-01 TaxID=3421634 RepID=UPI003D171250
MPATPTVSAAPAASGSVPSRRPRSDARANRAGILRAAADALARDAHASLDGIAREAGLSRRTLYGHFADRDALVHALIKQSAERFNRIAASISDSDSRVALARMAAHLWAEASHVQVAAALALDDAHVHKTALALAPLRERLLSIVRRGQGAHELRTDMAAETLSRLIEEVARTIVTRTPSRSHTSEDNPSSNTATVVVHAVLSIAGLSWRESAELLRTTPDLTDAGGVTTEIQS